jgi:S-sulfo-L-cysteine synthase (O-acetyl-L-serine-dependent)
MNAFQSQPPQLDARRTLTGDMTDLTIAIGNTPLLPISGLAIPERVTVLGKAEWKNPGGSVKDRAAWEIVRTAEAAGLLPSRTLLDATSGNTGIAYAWIGAARGFAVTLCVPANASPARLARLRQHGAIVIPTDRMAGTDGAQRVARELVESEPERYFYADQYSNPANPQAHYAGTALEIWEQTQAAVTHVVAGIGTSGTLVGTARRLRELAPSVTMVGVQPDSPYHALEGLKHLESAMHPAIYDARAHDRIEIVSSEDAIDMAQRQWHDGLPIGWSAGAALVAAERLASTLERGVIVAILPDGADRYADDPVSGANP